MKRLNPFARVAVASLVFAVTFGSVARAAVFSDAGTYRIVADGVVTNALTAPPGFFDDIPVGSPVSFASQYDDTATPVLNQCFNPNDPAQCYPVYGGGAFSLSLGGDVIDSASLVDGGPFIALDDNWFSDPTAGTIPPIGLDTAGVSFYGAFATLPSNPRWAVGIASSFITLPADTFASTAITGLDIYALGDQTIQLFIMDMQTGTSMGNVFAVLPEPSTSLLIGIGLVGLSSTRRRRRAL